MCHYWCAEEKVGSEQHLHTYLLCRLCDALVAAGLKQLLVQLLTSATAVMLLPLQFAGLGAAELGQQQQLEQRDAFARLHASMSLACVPASLPCRQEERGRLQGFVRRVLHEGALLQAAGICLHCASIHAAELHCCVCSCHATCVTCAIAVT